VGSVADASIEASLDAVLRLGEGCAAVSSALALEYFQSMKPKEL